MENIIFSSLKIPCSCFRNWHGNITKTKIHGTLAKDCTNTILCHTNNETFTLEEVVKNIDLKKKQTSYTIALRINSDVDLMEYVRHLDVCFKVGASRRNIPGLHFKSKKKHKLLTMFNFEYYGALEIINKDILLFHIQFQEKEGFA